MGDQNLTDEQLRESDEYRAKRSRTRLQIWVVLSVLFIAAIVLAVIKVVWQVDWMR
jgi:hypothetical protein